MISSPQKLFNTFAIALLSGILYCMPGGGIDIGNPTKICVVDSLNQPVNGASVKIIPTRQWFTNMFNGGALISDSSSTDISGYAYFDSLETGSYNLQIDCSSGGALTHDTIIADTQNYKVVMIKKYCTVSGTISSESDIPAQIHIAGTTYKAPVNADGSYTIPAIPEGMFVPVVMAADSQWTIAEIVSVAYSNTTVSTTNISFNSLLIEDFEDTLNTKKIGRIIEESRIYTGKADKDSGIAEYQIVTGGIADSKALKGTLFRKSQWALIGFFLGVKPGSDSLWDFSSAHGLSFYAKGKGKLNISIESDAIDKMETNKQFSSDIVMQPEWSRFTVNFDSLKFHTDGNPTPDISWAQASRSIKRIEFNSLEGSDTVELWLDDLKIEGLDVSKVFNP
jgi:hypothetical protein